MNRGRKKKSPVAVVCSALGTVLLILLIVVCLPLTVPRVFGLHIYTVVSGSMVPAIPTESLVYVKVAAPEDVKEEEVIAFYGGRDRSSIITHRVVANSHSMGEFITKGDANESRDTSPVPYADYIGKITLAVPEAGRYAQILTSTAGKIAAACIIGLAVFLHITAAIAEGRKK